MDSALQALPDRQRVALVLFHYEGASMAEVAEVLETSADAVESLDQQHVLSHALGEVDGGNVDTATRGERSRVRQGLGINEAA